MAVRDYPRRALPDEVPPPIPVDAAECGMGQPEAGQQEKAAALRAAFVQDGPADTLAPGALLAALTEAAFTDAGARLSDGELMGALEAARRLQNRAHYLETLAIAELARRRAAQYEEDKAAGVPRNLRRAQFPDLELSGELLIGRRHAQHLLDEAAEFTTRLPRTLAGMANGVIDQARASAIASATLCLSDADAARVDQALASTAHEVRADTVARRAGTLAMKLDPEAVRREKDDARRTRQRVEACREQSGNASFSIREADTSLVMSVQAAVNELAVQLRNGGAEGTLDSLRAIAALDRLLARDPLDRLAPVPPEPAAEDDDYPEDRSSTPGDCSDTRVSVEDEAGGSHPTGPGVPVSGQVKFPALINLIVPAATLLGWGTAPGQAGTWGLTDPQETRDIVKAASRHRRTRWCLTVVNERGEAVAHACAAGRHPWKPETPDPPPDTTGQSALIRQFLTDLGITPGALARIAQGTCDHQHAEPRYVPSRKLRHLIRARALTCTGPGCGAESLHADQDHVLPYPDGPTDECNLHTPCRSHHRAKQSPGWRVEQREPGVIRWTLPNGRTRTTRPTIYDF